MKNLYPLFILAALFVSSCKKDKSPEPEPSNSGSAAGLTVEEKNQAALIDFSETWCPPCGAYGGPAFDSLIAFEHDKLSCIKVYASSTPAALNSPVSSSWKNGYSVTAFPNFFVNNIPIINGGGLYSTVSANVNAVMNKANTFNAGSVVAGVALKSNVKNDTVTVETAVQFFKPQTAGKSYSLAVYVLEDLITAPQQVGNVGSGTLVSNYKHRNLLRTANDVMYTGKALNSGAAIAEDQLFNNTYKLVLNPSWNKSNLKIAAIIWNTTGSPTIVNSKVE